VAAPDDLRNLDINMRLHFDRLPDSAEVVVRQVEDHHELGDWFTAFRATPGRVELGVSNPFAKPMRVCDVAARMGEFSQQCRAGFHHFLEQFGRERTMVTVDVPAYDLGEHGLILLDGNHRVTAIWMTGVPFRINLHALRAPIDRRLLIDLKYWDGGWRRFLNRSRWGTSAGKARRANHSP
jgi:hypothetical protein